MLDGDSTCDRYRKLFKSIYDALFITSSDGQIIEFNDRALEYFKVTGEELCNRNITTLLNDSGNGFIEGIKEDLKTNHYSVIERRCRRNDSSTFQGEIVISLINLNDNGEICFLIRDISIRHKALNDLKHALERVEAISRARMEFVSNVSHELRTPLTSMIYAVKNMQNGHAGILNERTMQYLSRLESDCKRLLGTVNDILDLRQIENNTLVLTKTCVALRLIALSAIDSIEVQCENKQISLIRDISKDVNFVECDFRKIERVFINVIGNAIKFTPSGGKIEVSLARSNDYPDMAVAVISDNGIGIPKEMLSKVTGRYVQVGEQPVGTGLGLAITKELVELHGGKLFIESPVPGRENGTRVTFTLPLAESPKILLLSKRCENFDVSSYLDGYSLMYTQFSSAHAMIRHSLENAVNLIIVTNETDDLSPIDVIMRLKNDHRTSRIPIILITNDNTDKNAITLAKAFRIPITQQLLDSDTLLTSILNSLP